VILFFAADLPILKSGVDAPELPHRDPIHSLMGKRLVETTLQEMQPFDGDIKVDEYYFGGLKRY
jgi:hypothetical protein